MSDIIKLLPETIANQIAAGEVAPAPSYVVKELLENSIDAGATSIQLEVSDAGKTYIHVIDNGKGMSATDARMAFEKHATSKIDTADDLNRLMTMGFRGEALAAIAAIAQVELRTREEGSELGTEIYISGSEVQSTQPIVTAKGTSIKVKDIFFNTPARRRFLKSNEREYKAILAEFERVALVNPHVAMSLYKDGNLTIDLPNAPLKERILRLGGKRLEKDLLPIHYESSAISVSGYIGKPTGAKKSGAQQFFFVNNRFMKHPYFHKAITIAYEHLIPQGYQPNYFVYFTLPPQNIDVNINPTKTEIRFADEQFIWQILKGLVREALSAHAAVPIIDFDNPSVIDIPSYTGRRELDAEPNGDAEPKRMPSYGRRVFIGPNNSVPNLSTPSVSYPLRAQSSYDIDWSELKDGFERESRERAILPPTPLDASGNAGLFADEHLAIAPESQSSGHFIYKGRYIVTSLRQNLVLIDFYRAQIRVLYERFLTDFSTSSADTQELMYPEAIHLSPAEAEVAPTLLGHLSSLGFAFTQSDNEVTITIAPSCVALDVNEVFKTILAQTLDTGEVGKDYMLEHLALTLAKTKAKRQCNALSSKEVEELLALLFATTDPNLTPTGDKIIATISEVDIDQRFR